MLKARFQLTNVHVLNMKTRSSFLVNQNPASTKVLQVTLLEAHLSLRPKNNANVLLQRSEGSTDESIQSRKWIHCTISVFWIIDLELRGVLNVKFTTLIIWNAEKVSTYSGDRWLSTANGQQIVVD